MNKNESIQSEIDSIISKAKAQYNYAKMNRVTLKAIARIAELGLTEYVPDWMLEKGAKSDRAINEIIKQAEQSGSSRTAYAWTGGGDAESWTEITKPSALYLLLNEDDGEANEADEPTNDNTPAAAPVFTPSSGVARTSASAPSFAATPATVKTPELPEIWGRATDDTMSLADYLPDDAGFTSTDRKRFNSIAHSTCLGRHATRNPYRYDDEMQAFVTKMVDAGLLRVTSTRPAWDWEKHGRVCLEATNIGMQMHINHNAYCIANDKMLEVV